VRFDDRLLTVLNQPVSDRHDTAVRWRQLVELVARAGASSSSSVVGRALESIRQDSANVQEPLRAAAARAVAALPLPLGLLECFAADKLAVSAPVLAAATLQPGQWRALLKVADLETRGFIETLHPDIAPAPQPQYAQAAIEPPRQAEPPSHPEPAAEAEPAPGASTTAPAFWTAASDSSVGKSLSDVVARIERRRRSREPLASADSAMASESAPQAVPALFRWECQPSGEIAWVDGAPRGALIGRSIARAETDNRGGVDREVVRAFAMRAPFRDAGLMVPGDGAASGEWKISGVPAFDPADGRFAGYRGIAMRDVTSAAVPLTPPPSFASDVLADPDSLRELVHEIKTPLNAIIGFAEIIDGQYLGPADRRYRERAADIVVQANLLLGAIDDLDFAAQLHSSAGSAQRRSDLGEQVQSLAVSLRELAAARGIELDISRPRTVQPCRVEPELLDRLLYRLCATLIEHAGSGERLRLAVDQARGSCRFSISRPEALRAATEQQLFDASATGEGTALRVGFTLRLVRGLARIAGGDLVASGATISLTLPSA
jgi:hypothetical protein